MCRKCGREFNSYVSERNAAQRIANRRAKRRRARDTLENPRQADDRKQTARLAGGGPPIRLIFAI